MRDSQTVGHIQTKYGCNSPHISPNKSLVSLQQLVAILSWFIFWMLVTVGLWRKLSTEELMVLNCGVGEDSWESLGLQGDPTHPSKGDQSWVFIGRTDAKAKTPVLWPPHAKSWLIGKDPDAGKDWGQEEKGMTEDEMAGWHHWLDGCESEWTLGVGDGQGDLACCDSWGCKELDTTERLNWTELSPSLNVEYPL